MGTFIVTFQDQELPNTYNLSDTMEGVVSCVANDGGSYFVYNDKGEVLQRSYHLIDALGSVSSLKQVISFTSFICKKCKVQHKLEFNAESRFSKV